MASSIQEKTFCVETYFGPNPSVQYKDVFAESSNVAIILTNVLFIGGPRNLGNIGLL